MNYEGREPRQRKSHTNSASATPKVGIIIIAGYTSSTTAYNLQNFGHTNFGEDSLPMAPY